MFVHKLFEVNNNEAKANSDKVVAKLQNLGSNLVVGNLLPKCSHLCQWFFALIVSWQRNKLIDSKSAARTLLAIFWIPIDFHEKGFEKYKICFEEKVILKGCKLEEDYIKRIPNSNNLPDDFVLEWDALSPITKEKLILFEMLKHGPSEVLSPAYNAEKVNDIVYKCFVQLLYERRTALFEETLKTLETNYVLPKSQMSVKNLESKSEGEIPNVLFEHQSFIKNLERNPVEETPDVLSEPQTSIKNLDEHQSFIKNLERNPVEETPDVLSEPQTSIKNLERNPEGETPHVLSEPQTTVKNFERHPVEETPHVLSKAQTTINNFERHPVEETPHVLSEPQTSIKNLERNSKIIMKIQIFKQFTTILLNLKFITSNLFEFYRIMWIEIQ
ncbi:hypothetical protein FF38_07701 [Lucilia cuprina]|uniref:Uncharacterized protein n=1 Tax=Lucilia cuprina TaxID=7375 RepID=A0A0L0CIT6_LUCCU|nr:hypothetical protein FF38_07701 [Lucilia cuprina]